MIVFRYWNLINEPFAQFEFRDDGSIWQNKGPISLPGSEFSGLWRWNAADQQVEVKAGFSWYNDPDITQAYLEEIAKKVIDVRQG